jgi:cyclopropane fatty-acyl-phospholipid synthase-like methyltransferase
MSSAFITLYTGLSREGPGSADDVAWCAEILDLPGDAQICDAGCGSGGDISALLDAAPAGHVTALDSQPAFIDAARQDWAADDRVSAEVGNIAALNGAYDLIWSAGALYFLGVTEGLSLWKNALCDDGAVTFSEPCFFNDTPSADAQMFWGGYLPTNAQGIDDRVQAAGFKTVATRKVTDDGWLAYYQGLHGRIQQLRPGADAEMSRALDMAELEMTTWAQVKSETGYLLSIVRPQ